MAKRKRAAPPKPPKPPSELKALSEFLKKRGYMLAVPFDTVRKPGYIGRFEKNGQETVVDDGKCLKGVEVSKPEGVALGNYRRSKTFSWGSFFRTFGTVFGFDLSGQDVRDVSVNFSRPYLQTRFMTELAIEEYAEELSPKCKEKLTDPSSFLIVQVLETDSIEYQVTLGKKLDATAQADLTKVLKVAADKLEVKAEVKWQSATSFSLIVAGKTMTVGYKTAKAGLIPVGRHAEKLAVRALTADDLTAFRRRR